jgi:antitoxin ParD1/3/4
MILYDSMGKLERITITLPEEMAARLRAAVDSGEYATTSEVVRDALRDWTQHQERRQTALEDLRQLIAEADLDEPLDGPTVLGELRAKYRVSRN